MSNVVPQPEKEVYQGPELRLTSAPDFELSRAERIEALKASLPEHYEQYTDKYFLRAYEILRHENLNPFVRAQVFIRKGPGEAHGVDEACAVIDKYTDLVKNGGRVYAVPEGDEYQPKDTLMVVEGHLQDMVALETVYLGVLSKGTTAANDGIDHVDLDAVEERMKEIVEAAGGRPVTYFGARHWHFQEDGLIGEAAMRGGAVGAATDAAAEAFGSVGVGTIPHVLENAFATEVGRLNATVAATVAFDKVIDPEVPRIALIDYSNREIDDSIAVAEALEGRLQGVRVDTAGENLAQGALESPDHFEAEKWREAGVPLLDADHPDAKYWYGNGVTVTGVYALRKALDEAGHEDVQIVLTSGFGDPEKVRAFVRAEETLGIKLFDGLGVGGLYPSRAATMDVVGVRTEPKVFFPLAKVGRSFNDNDALELVLGKAA